MELFGITQKPYIVDIVYYDKPDSFEICNYLQVFENIDDYKWHVVITKKRRCEVVECIDIWRDEWKTIEDTYDYVKMILATSGLVSSIECTLPT